MSHPLRVLEWMWMDRNRGAPLIAWFRSFFFFWFFYLAKIAPLAPLWTKQKKWHPIAATEMQIAGRANKLRDFLVGLFSEFTFSGGLFRWLGAFCFLASLWRPRCLPTLEWLSAA